MRPMQRPHQPTPEEQRILNQQRANSQQSVISEAPTSPRHTPRTEVTPSDAYENYRPRAFRIHEPGESARIAIPQESPPITRPMETEIPIYYRDYLDPRAAASYTFVCRSVWYTQVGSTLSLCADCTAAEHSFCIVNRPRTV